MGEQTHEENVGQGEKQTREGGSHRHGGKPGGYTVTRACAATHQYGWALNGRVHSHTGSRCHQVRSWAERES
eukprot:565517-Hanusia_phi.AAC.1